MLESPFLNVRITLMSLRDTDWEELLYSIDEQACTPFIGAGACADWIPLSSEISNQMAEEYEYPLDDYNQLERVAQFVAMEHGDMVPKNYIAKCTCREPFRGKSGNNGGS